ncbi:MAG: hypothetical protein HOB14_07135 [Gammaproteobacteria bacterium]|jgi:preprotein translocase subunit SecF|nr:hypothetical protein [Gammaproteobacteria bacterium]MBT6701419.1 hypothetical protein [Gammaproteobacteria bacterium]
MNPIYIINIITLLAVTIIVGFILIKALEVSLKFFSGSVWGLNVIFNQRKLNEVKPKPALVQAKRKNKSNKSVKSSDLPKTIQVTKFQLDHDWSEYESPAYLRKGVMIH